jgi:hypothetical protein
VTLGHSLSRIARSSATEIDETWRDRRPACALTWSEVATCLTWNFPIIAGCP